MTYGPATDNDSRMLTADGVKIIEGGRYFDYYDMCWVTIVFGDSMSLSPNGKYWDGWFETRRENGSRGPTLNGERLSSVKPAWVKD